MFENTYFMLERMKFVWLGLYVIFDVFPPIQQQLHVLKEICASVEEKSNESSYQFSILAILPR
jgi:hypothetical protein